jgi:hypothetical protein
MNTKKTLNENNILTYQQSNDSHTFSNDVRNWKSVLYIHSKKKEICLDEIEGYLQKYFSNHMSLIHQYYQINHFIDKQMFENILRK